MRNTGIVRRIDELGRVVIPKEIRRTMRLKVGEEMEFFVSGEDQLVLKKYSELSHIEQLASSFVEAMADITDAIVVVTDTSKILAVGGGRKRELIDKKISEKLEKIIIQRAKRNLLGTECVKIADEDFFCSNQIVSPVIVGGDLIGSVIFLKINGTLGDLDKKLADYSTEFFGRIYQ